MSPGSSARDSAYRPQPSSQPGTERRVALPGGQPSAGGVRADMDVVPGTGSCRTVVRSIMATRAFRRRTMTAGPCGPSLPTGSAQLLVVWAAPAQAHPGAPRTAQAVGRIRADRRRH